MKQFLSPLAEPLGAVWLFMLLGVSWLLLRRQWRSAIWLGIPTVLLFLLGSTPLAETLVAAEEMRWVEKAETPNGEGLTSGYGERETNNIDGKPGADINPTAPADAVIVLGGGERISKHDPLGFTLGDGASRLLSAIDLVRSNKAKTLVLGGSVPLASNPELLSMAVVQDWVTHWGLIRSSITNLGTCLTTHDEAVAFKKLKDGQGWTKVVLVTSALHLRRSEALFHKLGMNVIPVAADFEALGVSSESGFSPFPRVHRLYLLSLYAHEKIGWWVYRARGWV